MSRSLMPLSLLEPVDAVRDVNSSLLVCSQLCKLPCIFLIISIFLLVSAGRISLAEPFATADFDGIWNLHGLVSGYPGDFQSWFYGTMTADSDGDFVIHVANRTGESNEGSGTFQITPAGIITMAGQAGSDITFHGVMNNKRDLMVVTSNDSGGGCSLMILTKAAGVFDTNDLQGKWHYHGLACGDRTAQLPGSFYGLIDIDNSGDASYSPIVDSEGNTEYIPSSAMFGILPDGRITLSTIDHFYAVMTQRKDMIVAVATTAFGQPDGVRGYCLIVMQKKALGHFTIGDIAGTWYVHILTSGYGADWRGWYHYAAFAHGHNFSWIPGSYIDSSGQTGQGWSGAVDITSEGIISFPDVPGGRGTLNMAGDISVGVTSDPRGGHGIVFSVGRNAADFDMDGSIDFTDFATFAKKWLMRTK